MSENEKYYTGKENLEVMKDAKNYNNFLFNLIYNAIELHSKQSIIVDFGAGLGTFAKTISEKYKENKLICIETDPNFKQILTEQGLSVLDDINKLPDNSITFLYSLNVLEHIKDDEDILRLWFKKLAPNGRILIYVPAFNILYTSLDKLVGHFRRYTKKELNDKLIKAGFDVKKIRYADCMGYFASLIFKYFGNNNGSINPRLLHIFDRLVFL